MAQQFCVCDHIEEAHTGAFYDDPIVFRKYVEKACILCGCFAFKLDNLRLIEDTAKEKI